MHIPAKCTFTLFSLMCFPCPHKFSLHFPFISTGNCLYSSTLTFFNFPLFSSFMQAFWINRVHEIIQLVLFFFLPRNGQELNQKEHFFFSLLSSLFLVLFFCWNLGSINLSENDLQASVLFTLQRRRSWEATPVNGWCVCFVMLDSNHD